MLTFFLICWQLQEVIGQVAKWYSKYWHVAMHKYTTQKDIEQLIFKVKKTSCVLAGCSDTKIGSYLINRVCNDWTLMYIFAIGTLQDCW